MTLFLAIQNTYDQLELGIFKDHERLAYVTAPKCKATALLIPLLQDLLRDQGILFSELSFLAVNQGPGPFSTLRVVLSSVNSLQFVTGIPLIGINALEALSVEQFNPNHPLTLIMLNAFGSEVYFGITVNGKIIESGCDNPQSVLSLIQAHYPNTKVVCIGNGISMYEKEIKHLLGSNALIHSPILAYPKLETIGLLAYEHWKKQEYVRDQLMPIYLKKAFKPS